MMKFFILLNIILSIILSAAASDEQESRINLIYTGGIDGELEPCGCSPKTDFGGVARLSGYLAKHLDDLYPYILIDAGNFSSEDTPQGRLKADAMLKSFSIMKYDAVAFAGKERAFPETFFIPLINEYTIPAVSGSSRYNQSISLKSKSLNINISVDPTDCPEDSLNILLTDVSIAESRLIKGWDVIINSSGELLEEPLRVNDTIIVSGYPKGKKLGILTIHVAVDHISDFKHRWQPLSNDVEEDKRVRNVLNDYDTRVARLLEDTGKPPSGTTYVGSLKCGECHQLFVESWKETGHASAFASLDEAGKSRDPECLICHTVGFGEEGGFYSIETTPELANVQCEACHGLDREHLTDFSKPMKTVMETVCLKCHTESNSPDFDYPVYLEKIRH